MATSDKLALVDANVLVYGFYDQAEHYPDCSRLLERAQDGDIALCVVPQVLTEFYAVITDGRRVTDPFEPGDALDAIDQVVAMPGMMLLPTPVDLVARWTSLARQHPVTRGAIFDLQLVAAMLGNEVRRIYTFDIGDFERFSELEVLSP